MDEPKEKDRKAWSKEDSLVTKEAPQKSTRRERREGERRGEGGKSASSSESQKGDIKKKSPKAQTLFSRSFNFPSNSAAGVKEREREN